MARKKSSIGCLFWIALILLVLVIFLFNRNTIDTVLEKTGLMTYLRRDTPDIQPGSEETAPDEEPVQTPPVSVSVQVIPDRPATEPATRETAVVITKPEEEPESTAPAVTPTPVETQRTRRSNLYFVRIGENSEISLVSVTRSVHFVDSPLTETIATLLKGLTASEINRGMLSLIPEGTLLKSVAIRGDTAFIDFNESFRFNSFGKEGYKYQLEQIVFTATEFQTVRSVQILIDGERISYLGPESPFVGDPLTRDSFS